MENTWNKNVSLTTTLKTTAPAPSVFVCGTFLTHLKQFWKWTRIRPSEKYPTLCRRHRAASPSRKSCRSNREGTNRVSASPSRSAHTASANYNRTLRCTRCSTLPFVLDSAWTRTSAAVGSTSLRNRWKLRTPPCSRWESPLCTTSLGRTPRRVCNKRTRPTTSAKCPSRVRPLGKCTGAEMFLRYPTGSRPCCSPGPRPDRNGTVRDFWGDSGPERDRFRRVGESDLARCRWPGATLCLSRWTEGPATRGLWFSYWRACNNANWG